MKKRDIVIDADHILFLVAHSKSYQSGFEATAKPDRDRLRARARWLSTNTTIMDNLNNAIINNVTGTGITLQSVTGKVKFDSDDDWGETPKIDLKPYKEHFKAIVNDYIQTAEVESICYGWDIGKVRVILSDNRNFRYDIYPEYKAKREEKSGVLKKLKKWAMKKYQVEPNTEADDVVAYYVRKGGLGFTTDKDLFKGVEGIWYNSHFKHKSWIRTSKKDAEHFFKLQALAGDPVDEIPALKGVGLPTAQKLLDKYGDSWGDILQIYLDRGYTKEYMLMNVRLVCMSQWSPKKGIVLWNF